MSSMIQNRRVLWVLLSITFLGAAIVFLFDGHLDAWVRVSFALTQLLGFAVALAHAFAKDPSPL